MFMESKSSYREKKESKLLQEKIGNIYEDNSGSQSSFGEKFIRKYVFPVIKPGMVIIDVGCGTGKNTIHLLEKIGSEGMVIGIDISENMIERACQKIESRNNLKFVVCGAEDIDKITETPVDIIISTTALHWVENIEKMILSCHKILKKSGRVMFAYVSGADHHPNEITDIYESEKSFEFFARMVDVTANKRLDPPERVPFFVRKIDHMERLLQENGFDNIDSSLFKNKKVLCPGIHTGKDIPDLIEKIANWMGGFALICGDNMEKRKEILMETASTIISMTQNGKLPVMKFYDEDVILCRLEEDNDGVIFKLWYEMIQVFGKKM